MPNVLSVEQQRIALAGRPKRALDVGQSKIVAFGEAREIERLCMPIGAAIAEI